MQDRVEGDEHGAIVGVAAGEVGPDQDHGDASSDANEDEPFAELRLVREEGPAETEHEEGAEDPVQQERDANLDPECAVGKEEV